jgi:hypothetical protein
MMPFAGYERVFSCIKDAVGRIPGRPVVVDRADLGQPLDASTLDLHITEYIDIADFGIAEISDHNPNVMLEVGIMIARDKPVILMVKQGTAPPVDLRGRYWCDYDPQDTDDSISVEVTRYIEWAINRVRAGSARPEYWARVYNKRDHAPLARAIEQATERILIHTTNLDWLTTCDAFEAIVGRLEDAQKPDVQVRILVLEPESEFAADRAHQLALDVRRFRQQLRTSLDRVRHRLAPFGERCKIATYSEFPMQIVIIVDNTVYCGVASANRRERENVIICLTMQQSNVKETFWDHFNTVWQRSEVEGGGKPGILP